MKTIEEKAKAYDEAVERASHIKDYKTLTPQETVEYIFPDLKESEDERIRKALIQFLRDYPTNLPNGKYSRSDFFTWLEKQKEPKPRIEICPHSIKSKSYKEQNPAWSEEDKETIDLLIEILKVNHPNGEFKTTEAGIIDVKYISTEEIISRLESLRPQPKQEWSEEDEEMLEYVIGDVNDAKQLYTTKEAKDMADKEIAWLKSLRPSWKPSEEQIAVLWDAISNLKHDGYKKIDTLIFLYEQLKSL